MKKRGIGSVLMLPWTKGNHLRMALLVFGFVALLAVPAVIGALARGENWGWVWLALPVLMAVVAYVGYVPIRLRMNRLRAAVSGEAMLQADCLMVKNVLQRPGIAQIRDGQLVLTPLIGKAISVPLSSVSVVKESSRFNGSWYPGQTGFWLKSSVAGWRLGFAVSDGEAWRSHLYGRGG